MSRSNPVRPAPPPLPGQTGAGSRRPPVFAKVLDVIIWVLFGKGVALVPVTLYTFGQAYLTGAPTPVVGVASCAAGSLAFGAAAIAIMVRSRIGSQRPRAASASPMAVVARPAYPDGMSTTAYRSTARSSAAGPEPMD